MQSLGALAHFDYNHPGAYSYEQALLAIRQVDLPMAALEQQFRRMLFNIVAQREHSKSGGRLANRSGRPYCVVLPGVWAVLFLNCSHVAARPLLPSAAAPRFGFQ